VVDLQYIAGTAVFLCTSLAYAIFLILGRRWRKAFEAEGVTYWSAPKKKQVAALTSVVWRPKLVVTLYGLAYFTNGYNRVCFSLWIPLFLFQVRNLGTVETALFVSLMYISWGWKMFLGIVTDAFPLRFRGKQYRRRPWFFVAGLLYLTGFLLLLVFDPTNMPIWTVLLPTITIATTAGAMLDIAADSYAVDATPPEWHGRVLGTTSRIGRVLGGISASLLPPILIVMGGYSLVFLSATLTGVFAFLCLVLEEPPLDQERVFSRKAIAFTFPEKTVLLGSLTRVLYAFSLKTIASPLGGMFVFIAREVVGISPELIGRISLVALLCGIPGAIIAGWAADKWGHKRLFVFSGVALAISGILWMSLREGEVMWFISTAMLLSFLSTFNMACQLALMGDITPLALSSTVFQMYMSFTWIANIPMSVLIAFLLRDNLPLCLAFMSFFTVLTTFVGAFIKPFEAAKAVKT